MNRSLSYWLLAAIALFLLMVCGEKKKQYQQAGWEVLDSLVFYSPSSEPSLIDSAGRTIRTRLLTPDSFQRVTVDSPSFARYLRYLPLKPPGIPVRYHDGRTKPNNGVYSAVVDKPIGDRNLHQCADAVIRLRAEYLFEQQQYSKISFDLTNGFTVPFNRWKQGNRVRVNGSQTSWTTTDQQLSTDRAFARYLTFIYTYAGSLSLSRELQDAPVSDLKVGDVFIQGGTPGHAVIVLDVARHDDTGKKIFLLAQSFMPAQETQILQNPNNSSLSPWYSIQFGSTLRTPEWTFDRSDLMRFYLYQVDCSLINVS